MSVFFCENLNTKDGNFEWIVKYDEIRPFLEGITNSQYGFKVLEIGCGTSTLSGLLADEEWTAEIVSVDNDSACIDHMLSSCDPNKKLTWLTYDIIEDANTKQNNVLDIDGYFDIIVDKGTFDAVHVEGSVAIMLKNIRRLLRVGGVYFLCSINSPPLLQALMSIPSLTYSVQIHQLDLSIYSCATVVLCTKLDNSEVDLAELSRLEMEISNQYFQNENPLLTEEREQAIRCNFNRLLLNDNTNSLNLELAHQAINGDTDSYSKELLLAYTFDLFLEDLNDFPLENSGEMTLEEVLRFVREKQ